MAFQSWWRRQARWKRIALAMVALYVVILPFNLLVRLALKGWEWHPDLWLSLLLTSSAAPLTIPFTAAMERWAAKRASGAGTGDRRDTR